ncbi:hypothetical protein PM082_018398 [Marasmius tenuissimus]|nr:hypothetical protein PM082_018398 [Marasmius tenuissimus]
MERMYHVAAATPFIPISFDRPPRDPAEKISSGYKAWEFLYFFGLGPCLLYGLLPNKYWSQYCKLHPRSGPPTIRDFPDQTRCDILTMDNGTYKKRMAYSAFHENRKMMTEGKECWLSDLQSVMRGTELPVTVHDLEDADCVMSLAVQVVEKAWSDNVLEIHRSGKLGILQSRHSPDIIPEKLGANFDYQRYLSTPIIDHRKSLTRFVTSTHRLAVETLRWTNTMTGKPIPRNARRCRYGCPAVEDEMHVFWWCDRTPIIRLERNLFAAKATEAWPEFNSILQTDNPLAIFNTAINNERIQEKNLKFLNNKAPVRSHLF